MSDSTPGGASSCERARECLHRLLDGDPVDDALEGHYRAHLAGCSSCREADRDLRLIQAELRTLPLAGLPDTALARVWRRTSGGRRRVTRLQTWGLDWRGAAAAAVLAVLLLGVWTVRPGRPSDEELNQAAVEARMVLLLTAKALRRSEEAVVREVLQEVSPALRRVPIPRPAEDSTR